MENGELFGLSDDPYKNERAGFEESKSEGKKRRKYEKEEKKAEKNQEKVEKEAKREWSKFYQEVFDKKINVGEIFFPSLSEDREEFNRAVIVDSSISEEEIYNKCKELFPCKRDKEGSFDKSLSSRPSNPLYCVWVEDNTEVNKELQGKTSSDYSNMSFKEYLLYRLKHFHDTGEHIDKKTATVCDTYYKLGWEWSAKKVMVGTQGDSMVVSRIADGENKPNAGPRISVGN